MLGFEADLFRALVTVYAKIVDVELLCVVLSAPAALSRRE